MNEIHPYPQLARRTVEIYLSGQKPDAGLPLEISKEAALWSFKRACFVSIKTAADHLRGCIGALQPTQPHIGQEIMAAAISAALRDPRFPPVTSPELADLIFSVDVLSDLHPVAGPSELDPARWGVVVSRNGFRGVLLPNLEGIDTVEKQLKFAAAKAGLSDVERLEIKRFSVERFTEKEASANQDR